MVSYTFSTPEEAGDHFDYFDRLSHYLGRNRIDLMDLLDYLEDEPQIGEFMKRMKEQKRPTGVS
jgi:spore coat polysaccharide biosynthesis protein SpsF (cytidylyltransferase family)